MSSSLTEPLLPSDGLVASSGSNASLFSSSSSDPSLVVDSVDLSVVWLLLAGFVLACLLLSAVGGVKWRRHKRWDELSYSQKAAHDKDEPAPDSADARQTASQQSTASEQLSSFSRQLHSQHASTVSLLTEQQSSVRSQLDRLCAEAEQLKALLAARLSGDRGFVDAAIALLLSDITAAESYRRRQAKREDDVLRAHNDCLQLLDEAAHALTAQLSTASTSSHSSVAGVKEAGESLIRCVSSAQREADKERARVRHSSASSSSILGSEAVALLTRHADEEAEAERGLARLLHTAHAAADNFLFACLEHDMDVNGASASASQGGSGSSSSTASSSTVYVHRLQLTCRRFHSELARSVGAWPAAAAAMAECRAARSDSETEALQCLERQKQQVDSEANRGLFAGLDQQLVDSLTTLIRQTAAQQQQSQQLAGGWRAAGALSAAAEATSSSSASSTQSSLLSALLHSAAQAATDEQSATSPFHADGPPSSSTFPLSLSSSSLDASFSAWRESDALLAGLLSADAARKVAVCGELDRSAVHSALSAADESRLRDATAAVTTLHSSHSAALVRLGERSRAEEQRAVEHRLAALRDKEREVERQREALQADFDARMASRATAERDAADDDSDGGTARRLQADLDAAMESLQAAQLQEALAAQTELHAIHVQHRDRLAAQQTELRRQQQQTMAEAVRQYELTHAALTGSADEQCQRDLQLEGVDVPSMRSATQQALSTASARESALVAFHQANLDELNRRQQTDRRLMEEEMEQRHRDAMQAVRADWDEDKERQRAMDEESVEQAVRAASDATAAAVVRTQHADETKKRERCWQEEWSLQEASSQQQHKAALDSRRQQLAAEQAAERAVELSDQRDEMFQVRIAACKQQEAALLDHALHEGTRADGRRLIESAMASRHTAERTRLIAQQELDNKQHIARLLEADKASLTERRQRLQRDVAESRLSESAAAAGMAAVDADGSSVSTSQRVFAAVAEAAAASLSGLQSRQWEEVKAAMQRAFPDEPLSGGGWQQRGSLSPDVAALAAHQAQVMQAAIEASREHVAGLEREEQAVVQRCRAEQQQRLEQLEAKLAREEAAIRAQFSQQLHEAQTEHEAKLGQLADDLQRVREQQPLDERAVAEYEAAIEDERQSHSALMQQAAEQFEAEVAVRSEAQRVHLRAANQQQLNETIQRARSDRQQHEKEAKQQQTRMKDDTRDDARRAMQLLERHGRRYRAKTQTGVKEAVRAMVARYAASQPPLQQRRQTEPASGSMSQRQPVSTETAAVSSAVAAEQLMVPAAAQLDRIEALIRQIAPTAATLQQRQLMPQPGPPSAASSPAAAHILASAIASSSLTARQRALLDSAQRVQTAICTSLALGFCELRLTAAASPLLGGQSLVSTLPLSHLYTLVPPPAAAVLLLHDQPHIPISQHCLALAFLAAARYTHFAETTRSPAYQTALIAALTAALESGPNQRHSAAAATAQAAQLSSASAVAEQQQGEKEKEEEAVDELNEQLCALLADPSTASSAVGSSRLRTLVAAIEPPIGLDS